jgi:hypothetical protein
MQADYLANGRLRLGRVCCKGQTEPGSGRLFLCAGCRGQAIICSCCDRGQIYCTRGCAVRARRRTLREAGRRYQASHRGRRRHAARMGRYRARREIVTHHGSPAPPTDDLLPATTTAITSDDLFPADRPKRSTPHGHWCGRPCLPQLRQGFLRRRDHRRGRVGPTRTEHKPPW